MSNLILESKPESDAEKGAYGLSADLEGKMKDMMMSHKLSDSPILTHRLLSLMLEVKALNSS